MARFLELTRKSPPGLVLVNLDLVSKVDDVQDNKSVILHFSGGHTIEIASSFRDISAVLVPK